MTKLNLASSSQPVFEHGVLVGWYCPGRNARGETVQMFIPRRDEDVEADRARFASFERSARFV